MLAFLPTALAFIAQVAPMLTSSAAVTNGIALVAQAAPLAIETYNDLMPSIKVAIGALRDNKLTTTEQLDELDVIEAKIDAAYDAASAKAKAEDAAASSKVAGNT